MAQVIIKKLNETFMSVTCSESYMDREIYDRFSFKVPNAVHDPRYKSGRWDGYKRLYNLKYKRIYSGLLLELLKFLKRQGYTYHIDPALIQANDIKEDEVADIVKELKLSAGGKPIEAHDYQIHGAHYLLSMGRGIARMSTSAGKSLTIYSVVRILQLLDDFMHKKIMIVVPSKGLVEQLYSDFEDYSQLDDSWQCSRYVQKISGDYIKQVEKHIVITTWQSLNKMPHWIMEGFGAIIVDEVHTTKANILTKLLENAVHVPIRMGLTGTMDEFESNSLHVQGLIGPVKDVIGARELIDRGAASDLQINMLVLDYPLETKLKFKEFIQDAVKQVKNKNALSAAKYNAELEFLYLHQGRREFIKSLVLSKTGNSLILFDRVEQYGRVLYDEFKAIHENTFLIIGEVSAKERERIRTILEDYDDAIVLGNFSIMSTGISIKKLHNMFMVSSTKSKIRVLQSIGRMMRLHDTKDQAQVYDLVDKLDYNGIKNSFMKHAEERVKFYTSENHKIKFFPLNMA
jgi:superfamily II DNA or RNA helicase